MTCLQKILLAGIAALGIGLAGAAQAQTFNMMTVPVPGGGVAQVRYVGDVPPQIVFVPAPAPFAAWTPVFGYEAPFAMLDRISAEMDDAWPRCSTMPKRWPAGAVPAGW